MPLHPLFRASFLVFAAISLHASAQTVACGGYHSLVLCTDGVVMGWGENSHGSVGNGTFDSPVMTPVTVNTSAIGTVTAVAASLSVSYAIDAQGHVWSWGLSNYGQLGNGSTTEEPLPVQVASTLTGTVATVAAGAYHAVALKDDGTLWAWGYNQYGMVGDNSVTQRTSPVAVSNTYGGGITAIACGTTHTLALKSDGSVWAWGRSEFGQCGIGGWTTLDEPIQCNAMSDSMIAVAAGSTHSLALKSDGTVWAWGRNSSGQLGQGSSWDTSTPNPLQVTGLSDVVRISAFLSTSYAVKADGTVWAWGSNAYYMMTDDVSASGSTVPVQVTSLGAFPVIYPSGGGHVMAINTNGELLSWGNRQYGAVGDGGPTTDEQAQPLVLTTACTVSTAVEENDAIGTITAYPNPTDGAVAFTLPRGTERLVLYNSTGQPVAQRTVMSDTERMDLSHCAPGLYTAMIEGRGGVRRVAVIKH